MRKGIVHRNCRMSKTFINNSFTREFSSLKLAAVVKTIFLRGRMDVKRKRVRFKLGRKKTEKIHLRYSLALDLKVRDKQIKSTHKKHTLMIRYNKVLESCSR